jgi:aldehyde dehydrogenase (NAD+)
LDDGLMHRRRFYVGGDWVEPAKPETFSVISPSSEAVVGDVPVAASADMDRAVEAARVAFEDGPWPRMSPHERSELLQRVAELLRKRTSDIAEVTTEEMGCAVSQAPAAQTGLVAPVFEYFATLIRTFEFEREVSTGDRASLVTSEPTGVSWP